MNKLRTMVFASLFLLSMTAKADWHGPYAVELVEVADSGVYFFSPAGYTFPNLFGCQNPSWIVFDPSTPLANRALSVAMSAQAMGKKVKFNITGCFNTYIKASGIQIDPNW